MDLIEVIEKNQQHAEAEQILEHEVEQGPEQEEEEQEEEEEQQEKAKPKREPSRRLPSFMARRHLHRQRRMYDVKSCLRRAQCKNIIKVFVGFLRRTNKRKKSVLVPARVSDQAADLFANLIDEQVGKLVRQMVISAEYRKRQTIGTKDAHYALRRNNIVIYDTE